MPSSSVEDRHRVGERDAVEHHHAGEFGRRLATLLVQPHVARGIDHQAAAERMADEDDLLRQLVLPVPGVLSALEQCGVGILEQIGDSAVHLVAAQPHAVGGEDVRRQRRGDDDAVRRLGQVGRGVVVEDAPGQEAVLQIDDPFGRRRCGVVVVPLREVPVRGHDVAAAQVEGRTLDRDTAARQGLGRSLDHALAERDQVEDRGADGADHRRHVDLWLRRCGGRDVRLRCGRRGQGEVRPDRRGKRLANVPYQS